MTVNQRIEEVIKIKFDGNTARFARKIGVSSASIYTLLKSGSGPGFKIIHGIASNVDIDANWLITGRGDMDHPYGNMIANEPPATYGGKDMIPMYDIDVLADTGEAWNNQTQHVSAWIKQPGIENCDFAARTYGESMVPAYNPGELLFYRKVGKDIIKYGHAHLIITKDHRMLKYLRKHKDKSKVIARSANKLYDDITLKIDDIISLYIVHAKFNQSEL